MRLLSVILFLLFSCNSKEDGSSYLHKKLWSVFEVSEINPRLVNTNSIKLAPGAWHTGMRLRARINDFNSIDYCLLVKTPYELETGELKFVQTQKDRPCTESFFSSPIEKSMPFYNLKIDHKEGALVIKLDRKILRYEFKNMSSSTIQVSLRQSALGEKDENVLEDGVVCRQVNDNCSMSMDRCNLCKNGSYYIKNSLCSKAYSKVCGIDNCGQKNSPACIRGEVSTGVKDYCIQDSPVGFCSGNARVGCVNKLLICE